MNNHEIKICRSIMALGLILFLTACSQNSNTDKGIKTGETSMNNQPAEKSYKVTFIELGSVRCIPCKQMQSVMKSIESKYSKDVKVVFYDVWTDEGKPYGVKYSIGAIPTQVFLDPDGKEYYRHEGFFPENDLVNVLLRKGVKPD